jgi:hypothetical protein
MRPRAYAVILVAVLLVGCAVYLSGQFILYRAGETASVATVIERQRQTDGLYFGLATPAGSYKLAAYAERKPEIVILGSSRAHRQHQEFYNRPSYSMSGLVLSPETAVQVLDLLLTVHQPKVVIFNLDFYSFCTMTPVASDAPSTRHIGRPQGGAWQPVNQFAIIPKLVANGALSVREAADFAFGRFDDTPRGIRLFGLVAIKRQLGFRLDGAISEVETRMQDQADFEAAKQEVLTGTRHYPAGCHYDPAAMTDLETLQQEADRAGVSLIIILPPVAPSIYRLFATAPANISGYYATWQRERAKRHFPDLHDLVDGAKIGAADSEFADAVHGGDVSEARMLLKAAEAPGTILGEIINRAFLEQLVRDHVGKLAVEMAYFRGARAGGALGAVASPRSNS